MAINDELTRIIAGCKAGREESFEKLIDVYAARCYGYFYRLTASRDLSDELLSRLFVKLVEKIGAYRGGSFDGWLFRIASNIFHDHLRSKLLENKLFQAAKDRLESQSAGTHIPDDDRIDNLQIQLQKLDVDTREAIMLRFYSQLSFKEIAHMRREPIGTTLARVHRGLKKLRGLMEK
ncbi:MAG: RNA polymerase sigma factor [Planctomycetota bacterium]|jgi:RNA polymerase sigma-70 factor (ECF subfamily)